ncbi:MAG: DUF6468 domain-containing protein [Pseudomonadota bacterium]
MSLIADGILIVTCLTTAIYCYVLSRRLTKLSNTDEGIGRQIAQLNAGLEDTRSAVKEIRATTKAASDKLTREVAHARKIATQLSRLNERALETSRRSYQAEPLAPQPTVQPKSAPILPEETSAPEALAEDPEIPEIVEELAAPIAPPELDEDAAAELDASESAFAPEGRQQLGFLPEVDVLDDIDDEISLGTGPGSDEDDDLFAEDDLADLTLDTAPDETSQKGLLKVERVAL